MRFQNARCLLSIVLCSFTIDICLGLGKPKAQKPNKNPTVPPTTPAPTAIQRILGDGVQLDRYNSSQSNRYDNSKYEAQKGTAYSSADLTCDFEKSTKCCWKNAVPPYDTMDWAHASGFPDPYKLKTNFGTQVPPSRKFLIVSSDSAAYDNDKAELESCTLCASDPVKVSFRHWTTPGVSLQVCEIAASDPTQLLTCQDVPTKSPGPDTVTLPAGSNILLTIIAKNFTARDGSLAVIDDVNVTYISCNSPPTTVAPSKGPPSTGAGGPSSLCCGFDKDACQWSKGNGPASSTASVKGFEKAGPQRYNNRATGVPPSQDKNFYAAYLKSKEAAYAECPTNLNKDTIIKFQEYKATENINLKVCCDTTQGCSYETGGKTNTGDYNQWYQGSIKCPAGTKKVAFYSENTGKNEGGVGIDNIQVFDTNGQQIC